MMLENRNSTLLREAEGKGALGIGVAIVRIDPSKNGENITNPTLWTNRELKPKAETGRVAGQITIPSDTRKIGEGGFSNVLGTLAEFSDDDLLIRDICFMRGFSYFKNRIWVKGNPFDFAVLVVDKPITDPIVPVDVDEVVPNGWMSLEDLRIRDPNMVRSFVGQVVGSAGSRSVISDVVESYFNFPEKRIPLLRLLPPDFSITSFFNKRERLPDVVGNSGVIYSAK